MKLPFCPLTIENHQGGQPSKGSKSRRKRRVAVAFWMILLTLRTSLAWGAAEVENAREVSGFRGEIEGRVKSAKADGSSMVIVAVKATFDPAQTLLKDNAPLVGKELTIGVRMPKTNEQPHPHPDDLAYIKSLKAGDFIAVKIFSVFSSPRVLRIQQPGHPAKAEDASAK